MVPAWGTVEPPSPLLLPPGCLPARPDSNQTVHGASNFHGHFVVEAAPRSPRVGPASVHGACNFAQWY